MEREFQINFSHELTGYEVSKRHLQYIEEKITDYIQNLKLSDDELKMEISVSFTDKTSISMNSFTQFYKEVEKKNNIMTNLQISINMEDIFQLKIEYDLLGFITLNGVGQSEIFIFYMKEIEKGILALQPNSSSWEKLFLNDMFNLFVNTFSTVFFIAMVSIISFNTFYFFKAKKIGINISEALFYQNNEFMLEAERAINSDDLQLKLDTILKSQLSVLGYTNSNIFIEKRIIYIKIFSIVTFSYLVVLLIFKRLSKFYFGGYFIFGKGESFCKTMKRKRDLWKFSILLSLFINLISGTLLLLLT